MVKILYFDTSALVKYYCREKGHDLIKWVVKNRHLYSLTLHTSQTAIYELPIVLKRKLYRKELTDTQFKRAIANMKHDIPRVFHVRDFSPKPGFKSSADTDYQQLCKKHNLQLSKESRDARHLACVINHLRCCAGLSRPRILTSDIDFIKMITNEGYDSINPEHITKEEFLQMIAA